MDTNKEGRETLPGHTLLHLLRSPWKHHVALWIPQSKRITHEFNDLKDTKIRGRINAIDEILKGLHIYCPERIKYDRYYLVIIVLLYLRVYWFRCSMVTLRGSFSECSQQIFRGFTEQPRRQLWRMKVGMHSSAISSNMVDISYNELLGTLKVANATFQKCQHFEYI